jgi:hypothetical protein
VSKCDDGNFLSLVVNAINDAITAVPQPVSIRVSREELGRSRPGVAYQRRDFPSQRASITAGFDRLDSDRG